MNRGGTMELPLGELGAQAPVRWLPLASAHGEKPIARTVRISVARAPRSEELAEARFSAGVWWTRQVIAPDLSRVDLSSPWIGNSEWQTNAALRFRYGSQSVQRTLICDLASGEYQLPSCQHLSVEAARYTPGLNLDAIKGLGLDVPIEVQAEISDGTAADFTPMIVSAPSSWATSAVFPGSEEPTPPGFGDPLNLVIASPPGAYAWELYPNAPEYTYNHARFEINPPGAVRDWSTREWFPAVSPLPMLLDALAVIARNTIEAPAPASATIIFFVR